MKGFSSYLLILPNKYIIDVFNHNYFSWWPLVEMTGGPWETIQASDLENSYIGDDRDIVVDIGQISDPSYYLDLLFSLSTTHGNSNGQR